MLTYTPDNAWMQDQPEHGLAIGQRDAHVNHKKVLSQIQRACRYMHNRHSTDTDKMIPHEKQGCGNYTLLATPSTIWLKIIYTNKFWKSQSIIGFNRFDDTAVYKCFIRIVLCWIISWLMLWPLVLALVKEPKKDYSTISLRCWKKPPGPSTNRSWLLIQSIARQRSPMSMVGSAVLD